MANKRKIDTLQNIYNFISSDSNKRRAFIKSKNKEMADVYNV